MSNAREATRRARRAAATLRRIGLPGAADKGCRAARLAGRAADRADRYAA